MRKAWYLMNKKRIYLPYILGSDSPITYLYQNIATLLDKSKFEVTVLVNEQKSVVDSTGVTEVPGFGQSTMKKYLPYGVTSFRNYDLIHTGGYPRIRYLVSLLTRLRNPDIKQIHSLRVDVDPEGRYRTDYKRKLVGLANAVTAVSEHTAGTAVEAFGVEPKVIYNGVDVDLFRPDYSRPPLFDRLNVDRPVLLYVGSFEPRKRPRAVVEIARRLDEFEVVMIGDGTLYEELVAEAQDIDSLSIPGRIPKRDLPAVYANAAGFVFPSVREGCPNVVLEAMAAGTPVVGYEATSMPELITDGERGYLVTPDDIDALVVAAARLADSDDRQRLGANARDYVEAKHTLQTIVGQYQALYEHVLS